MSHYFTNDQIESKEITFDYNYYGHVLKFSSDLGVFSKERVDFGSNLLLHSVDQPFGRILDLGCGIGVIGLCLAKNNPDAFVEMVDINNRALTLAKKNSTSNDIKNTKVYYSNLYENVNQRFDWIITNPPIRAGKKIVHQIVEQSLDYLLVGGSIIVVIQKKQGAMSLQDKLEQVFGNVLVIAKKKGYYILKSDKVKG